MFHSIDKQRTSIVINNNDTQQRDEPKLFII